MEEAATDPAGTAPLDPLATPLRLDPRMRWVWTVEAAAGPMAVSLVIAVVAAALDLPSALWTVPAAIFVGGVGIAIWYPWARHRRFTYRLGMHALEIAKGVAWRQDIALPYFRVQHVDIAQGPVERLLGLAHLVVHTAAAAADATLPGIPAAQAPRVRQVLLERTAAAATGRADDTRDAV